jgi:hypothetical protein
MPTYLLNGINARTRTPANNDEGVSCHTFITSQDEHSWIMIMDTYALLKKILF